jgi:hypothetical protein
MVIMPLDRTAITRENPQAFPIVTVLSRDRRGELSRPATMSKDRRGICTRRVTLYLPGRRVKGCCALQP